MLRSRVLLALGCAIAFGAGCTPSCERTCRKLLDCGSLETDRVSLIECEASCQRQVNTYQGWDDEKELEDAFDDHRRCLVQSSCGEIEDGACYDERLFSVGVQESTLDSGL